MGRDSRIHPLTPRSAMAAPAIAGSIALALAAAPSAAAAEVPTMTERMPRTSPSLKPVTALGAPVRTAAVPATYTVRAGDTVSAIAGRYGLRTADVLALNGLSWRSVIHPGQTLKLTGGSTAASAPSSGTASTASSTYTVRAGDTISAIAARHKVSIASVFSANGLGWRSIIHPGQKITIPGGSAPAAKDSTAPAPSGMTNTSSTAPSGAASSGSYTVRAGDTISAIASRHKVSIAAVLSANGLGWSSIIYPGQRIAIPGGSVAGLDAEQVENARLIISVGRELGVPDRGIAIALGTAMQESWIRNLDWGDRDSLGLFQQRPSTGWGTADQVRDRVRSIKAFFGGPGDPNGSRTRGLLDVPGWQSMSFAAAAQAVQISAYPDRYAQWEKPAYAWLAALG